KRLIAFRRLPRKSWPAPGTTVDSAAARRWYLTEPVRHIEAFVPADAGLKIGCDTGEKYSRRLGRSGRLITPPHLRRERVLAPDSATRRIAPKAASGAEFRRRSILPWRAVRRERR